MTKQEIIAKLNAEITSVEHTLQQTGDAFFARPGQKWSVAENAQHMVLSARPLILAFSLPKFVLRLFGKPWHPSYSYDEIVKRYTQLLKDGAKAPATFVPRGISVKGDTDAIIGRFKKTHQTLVNKVEALSEEDLENYLLPHPLLGKLTIREMLYFTAYHLSHHHKAMQERIAEGIASS